MNCPFGANANFRLLQLPLNKVFLYIKNKSGKMAKDISKDLNIPFGTVDRHIRVLLKKNLIERKGSKKTGGCFVV